MGDIIRHHHRNGGCRSLELVNVRSLNENGGICVSGSHCQWPDHYRSPSNERSVKNTSSKSSSQSLKSWWNDPERKRQRRISTYKYYGSEANVKRTIKKGLKWLGKKCSMIIPWC